MSTTSTTCPDVDDPDYVLARVPADTPRPSVLTDSNVRPLPDRAAGDPESVGFWSAQVCPGVSVSMCVQIHDGHADLGLAMVDVEKGEYGPYDASQLARAIQEAARIAGLANKEVQACLA